MRRTALTTALWVTLAATLAWATPLDRLERLAATDLFPEVRAAAARVLAERWVEDAISDEALVRLTSNGASPELRAAAERALAARLVAAAPNTDALIALAASDGLAQVRALAGARLALALVAEGRPVDELIALAQQGATPELRGAAVPALAVAWADSALSLASLAELAKAAPTPEAQQAAAGAVLARASGALEGKTSAELVALIEGAPLAFERVVGANSAPLRQAAASTLSAHFSDPSTPLDEIETTTADPANSAELRQAAGQALRQRLLGARRSLEALTELAGQGATPELRQAAVGALEQALVLAVGAGQLTLQALVDSVSPEDSDALNAARANAAFTLLRPNLIFVIDQPLLEALIRGQTAAIGGVRVDGQNPFLRQAAIDFLAGLFLQFGAVNRFDDPLNELLAMAGDPDTEPGFRQAAGTALVKFLSAQRQKALDAIVEITRLLDRIVISGRRGQSETALDQLAQVRALIEANTALLNTTAEAAGELGTAQRLRTIKDALAEFPAAIRTRDNVALRDINSLVFGEFSRIQISLAGAPDTDEATLVALAGNGATIELRRAAATVLANRLNAALAAGAAELDALLALARDGASLELQGAAVEALARALAASDSSDDDLLTLVLEGVSPAVQAAGARAWVARQDQDVARFVALANGSGVRFGTFSLSFEALALQRALGQRLAEVWRAEAVSAAFLLDQVAGQASAALQAAAGAVLGERLFAEGRTQGELIELAVGSASPEVRAAAGEALAQLLISQTLPEAVLFDLISRFTTAVNSPLTSPELARALTDALADRLRNPLFPPPAPSTVPALGKG